MKRTGVLAPAPAQLVAQSGILFQPQDRPGDHLRALEAVVRTMRNDDDVKQLRACTTRDELWSLLERAPGWQ